MVTIADETGARLALVGNRPQVPAVGRGGVLDLAVHWAGSDARLTLDNVHRFADPDYAKLSLAMRSAENPEAGSTYSSNAARSSSTPDRRPQR
jgi:hypothetical protein